MTTLLVDADIVAFKAAARAEEVTAFGKTVGPIEDAKADCDATIRGYEKLLGADSSVMALSCRRDNFRNDVLPSYKMGRDSSTRPEHLTALKLHLAESYPSKLFHRLEGDDVLGILQTKDDSDTIIVSEDKDLRTVPGKLYAPHRDEVGLIDITPLEANQFLMWQTICGDSTDGFKGALGVGKRSPYAEAVLAADADELWDIVTEAYASVDMTEDEAIVQARCAKILTIKNFNLFTKEVTLWTPKDLEEI